MANRIIFILVGILFFSLHFYQNANAQKQYKRYDLYLLIGQSNMAGRGKVEAQDKIPSPRVYALDKDNNWIPAVDPIHFDKTIAGVGLGRSFGIAMADNDPYTIIGLIPCAVGGSPIDTWKPGVLDKNTQLYPWDDMVKRLKIALRHGELKGILWHQGESDSNLRSYKEYKSKLIDLINRVRAEAGDRKIPFVAGELGKFYIKRNKKEFEEAPAKEIVKSTREAAREGVKVGFVFSNGLKHKGDETHFDATSYRELGVRYANEMIRLQNLK